MVTSNSVRVKTNRMSSMLMNCHLYGHIYIYTKQRRERGCSKIRFIIHSRIFSEEGGKMWKVDFQSIKPVFGRVYSSWKKGKMIYNQLDFGVFNHNNTGFQPKTIEHFNRPLFRDLTNINLGVDSWIV